MKAFEFWALAQKLFSTERSPAGYRTVTSRAYYAAFLTARELLGQMGVPRAGRTDDHQWVPTILGNSGDGPINTVGMQLRRLRDERNRADYDLANLDPEEEAFADQRLREAASIITEIDACRRDAGRLARVTAATQAWARQLQGLP